MNLADYRAATDQAAVRAKRADEYMAACRRRYEVISDQVMPRLERGRRRSEQLYDARRDRASAGTVLARLALPAGGLRRCTARFSRASGHAAVLMSAGAAGCCFSRCLTGGFSRFAAIIRAVTSA